MPNCCVPDCKNSSAKGYLLKCFPKNEKRRAQWIKNINRPDWIPNHCHRVCEAHFASSMWEKTRVDGSRKLKFNAIPTIFEVHTANKPLDLTVHNSNDDNHEVLDDASTKKMIIQDNQTLIKIIPSDNSTNLQSTPIFIPASTFFKRPLIAPKSAIIVNSQGKVINSQACPTIPGATSILKTPVKTMIAQSSPMMISTNPSILQNQIRASNSQKPIIIPPNTSILKSQVQTAKSQLTSINLTNVLNKKKKKNLTIVIQDTSEISKSTLVPVLKKVVKHELPVPNSQTTSTIIMETVTPGSEEMDSEPSLNTNQDDFEEYPSDPENLNEQKSSVTVTLTPGSEEMDSEPSLNTNQDDFEEYSSDPENSKEQKSSVTVTVTPGSEEMDSEPSLNTNQDDFEEYSSDPEYLNEQKSSVASSTGIIMNKAQAKKLEDERFEKMDKLLLKQLKSNNALRKQLYMKTNKMQRLIKEQKNDCRAFLKNVFTDDQIRALELRHTNPKSITAWSYKTMMKAMKLKQECGTRGYEELLAQNLPLPSIRTICRWCTKRNIPIP